MKIISYISKQWTLRNRDWVNSLFYTVSVPVLYAILSYIDSQLALEELGEFRRVAYLAVSAGLPHIIRKLQESHKIITMQKVDKEGLPAAEQAVEQANQEGAVPVVVQNSEGGSGNVPPKPPIADPTNPKP